MMVVQKSYAKVSPNQQKKWAADLVPQLSTLYYSIKSSAKCGDMKKDEARVISQPLSRSGPRFGSTNRLEVGFGGEVVTYSGFLVPSE